MKRAPQPTPRVLGEWFGWALAGVIFLAVGGAIVLAAVIAYLEGGTTLLAAAAYVVVAFVIVGAWSFAGRWRARR